MYPTIHRWEPPLAILLAVFLIAAPSYGELVNAAAVDATPIIGEVASGPLENGIDPVCPHCGSAEPAVVTVEVVDPLDLHEPMLSGVVVEELPSVACPDCGQPTFSGEQDLDVWEVLQGDCRLPDHSVRDELARRRQSRMGYCDGAAPRYRLRAGAVWMQRVKDDWNVLIESTANPLRQLNADRFDFDWEPGLDLSFSRICWDDHQCEIRFLGLREFEAGQQIDIQGSDVRINSSPPVFVPAVNSIDSNHSCDLYGFELNWHYVTYRPFNYIFGFRYLGLDEQMSALLNTPVQTHGLQVATQNRLYGMQFGIESVPELPLFDWHCLTWFAKAGIFGNDADQKTVLATSQLGQIVNESPDTSAVVWEFGVGLDLPLSDCVSVQGGYSALIVDRIAVAADQLETIDFLQASGSDNRGTVMFHGASLFLVWDH